MELEGRRLRPLRYTLVGLANGVSLMVLAVFVAAYGTGTAIPFYSVDEFLQVATVWARGPRSPTLAWVLGYLGVTLFVLSPLWFLLVGPASRSLLDLEFSTTPIERLEEDEGTDGNEAGETRATRIDETGTGSVRGGAAGRDTKEFSLEDVPEEEESELADEGD